MLNIHFFLLKIPLKKVFMYTQILRVLLIW